MVKQGANYVQSAFNYTLNFFLQLTKNIHRRAAH